MNHPNADLAIYLRVAIETQPDAFSADMKSELILFMDAQEIAAMEPPTEFHATLSHVGDPAYLADCIRTMEIIEATRSPEYGTWFQSQIPRLNTEYQWLGHDLFKDSRKEKE